MIVRTRKYQLPKNTYIRVAFFQFLRRQWWIFLIALAIASNTFWLPSVWWPIGAGIALVLYLLFWLIQFVGVTQLEQSKILFERLSYEISSQQVLIKVNPKQGMPIPWAKVKRARKGRGYFLLILSKAQFIYLPFKLFNSEHERKFLETVLRRKKYIK